MADASLNYKRVSQMGNHIHNDCRNYRRVVELVSPASWARSPRSMLEKSPTPNFEAGILPPLPA